MTNEVTSLETDPGPPEPKPVGGLAIAGLLGALLLITATFLPWVSLGNFATVSGVDVGLDGYVVLAAGVIALITVLQLLTSRLLSHKADRPLAIATVVAGCLAAGILVYFAVKILGTETESTGSDFGDSFAEAFKITIGAGVWLGLAGAVLTIGSMLIRAMRGGDRTTVIGILIAAVLAAGGGAALAGSGDDATDAAESDVLSEGETDIEEIDEPDAPPPVEEEPSPPPAPAETLSPGTPFEFANDDNSIQGTVLVSSIDVFTVGQGEYAEPPERGRFVVADVTITVTTGSLSVNPYDFGIEGADGSRYEHADGNAILSGLDEPSFNSEELTAGSKLRGKIVFDVPESNGSLTYSPGDRAIVKWLY